MGDYFSSARKRAIPKLRQAANEVLDTALQMYKAFHVSRGQEIPSPKGLWGSFESAFISAMAKDGQFIKKATDWQAIGNLVNAARGHLEGNLTREQFLEYADGYLDDFRLERWQSTHQPFDKPL